MTKSEDEVIKDVSKEIRWENMSYCLFQSRMKDKEIEEIWKRIPETKSSTKKTNSSCFNRNAPPFFSELFKLLGPGYHPLGTGSSLASFLFYLYSGLLKTQAGCAHYLSHAGLTSELSVDKYYLT